MNTLNLSDSMLEHVVLVLWATNKSGGRHPSFDALMEIQEQTGLNVHDFLTPENIRKMDRLVQDSDHAL